MAPSHLGRARARGDAGQGRTGHRYAAVRVRRPQAATAPSPTPTLIHGRMRSEQTNKVRHFLLPSSTPSYISVQNQQILILLPFHISIKI